MSEQTPPTPVAIEVPEGKWYVLMNGIQVATLDGPVTATFSLQVVPPEFQKMPKLENGDA